MTHFIQQQHLHVSLSGTEEEGLALQNRLPGLCNDWLEAAIGQVLDRCAPAEGRLYIERLELDLGTIPLDRLEQELVGAVASALEAAIRDKAVPAASDAPSDSPAVQLKTNPQTNWEAFVYFLETGRLPWSFRLPAGESLEMLLTKTWADSAQPVLSLMQIKKALAGQTARQRLTTQFSVSFVEKLIAALAPELPAMVQKILSLSGTYAPLKSFERQLWGSALAQIAQGDVTREAALLAGAIQLAQPLSPEIKMALREVLERLSPDMKDVDAEDLAVLRELRKETSDMPRSVHNKDGNRPGKSGVKNDAVTPGSDMERNRKRTVGGDAEKAPDSSVPSDVLPKDSSPGKDRTPSDFSLPDGEAIYIDNAGLVILHPFLQMFFEGLEIARDGAILQPDRALHLLHYLCTGQTPAPEYELILPKVLCNIALETPVEADITLTEAEKEEATALLQAAIRWWEALRDTSPDALRGTFLCRPGRLTRREDGGWLLQVERQGFDVLLDQLPWGISMVKLAWMEEMVWVEWG